MIDVYRTPAVRPLPACMHCMTNQWAAFDVMWNWWICMVCGEIWEEQ
jgi:hypothetical protein